MDKQNEEEDVFVDVEGIRFIASREFTSIYGEHYTLSFEEGRLLVRAF